MGRGVSFPSGALVAFDQFACDCGERCDCWQYFRDDLTERAAAIWPSLSPCREWLGREDFASLSNNFAYFGVSEYCGIVAVWLAPRRDLEPGQEALAARWLAQVRPRLAREFRKLERLGTASNGESFYRRVS